MPLMPQSVATWNSSPITAASSTTARTRGGSRSAFARAAMRIVSGSERSRTPFHSPQIPRDQHAAPDPHHRPGSRAPARRNATRPGQRWEFSGDEASLLIDLQPGQRVTTAMVATPADTGATSRVSVVQRSGGKVVGGSVTLLRPEM
jgi:hypothetical protein